jgi:hypothetical protein
MRWGVRRNASPSESPPKPIPVSDASGRRVRCRSRWCAWVRRRVSPPRGAEVWPSVLGAPEDSVEFVADHEYPVIRELHDPDGGDAPHGASGRGGPEVGILDVHPGRPVVQVVLGVGGQRVPVHSGGAHDMGRGEGGLEKQRVVALHGPCGVPRAVPQVVEVGGADARRARSTAGRRRREVGRRPGARATPPSWPPAPDSPGTASGAARCHCSTPPAAT